MSTHYVAVLAEGFILAEAALPDPRGSGVAPSSRKRGCHVLAEAGLPPVAMDPGGQEFRGEFRFPLFDLLNSEVGPLIIKCLWEGGLAPGEWWHVDLLELVSTEGVVWRNSVETDRTFDSLWREIDPSESEGVSDSEYEGSTMDIIDMYPDMPGTIWI